MIYKNIYGLFNFIYFIRCMSNKYDNMYIIIYIKNNKARITHDI